MENSLSDILERVDTWPEAAKEDLLRAAEYIEREKVGLYKLSSAERAAVEEGLAEANAEHFATDEEMKEFFSKCRS